MVIEAVSHVQAALGLVLSRPTAVAAVAGQGARGATDRLIAPVVQWMVREIVLVDVGPDVAVGPLRERVELPDAAHLVPLDRLGVRARGRLLAPDPRDPRIRAGERLLERVH